MTEKKAKRFFAKEFRREVVARIETNGLPVKQVSAALNVAVWRTGVRRTAAAHNAWARLPLADLAAENSHPMRHAGLRGVATWPCQVRTTDVSLKARLGVEARPFRDLTPLSPSVQIATGGLWGTA